MSGITWNNVILSATQTLNSNLNIGGNLTTQTTAVVLNGIFNVNVGGNLTINIATSGTATIVLNGTGTWTHGSSVYLSNNLTINTAGTITIGTNVYYNTGTLTYTTGTVVVTGSTLNISANTTLNTDSIVWSTILTSGTTTLTLSSNLSTTNLTVAATSLTFTLGGNVLSVSNTLTINNSSAVATFNLPQDLQVTNLVLGSAFTGIAVVINVLYTLSVSGNLSQGTGTQSASGTATIVLNGTGSWTNGGSGPLQNNLTIDTTGIIAVSSVVYYNSGTLKYIKGTVNFSGGYYISLGTSLSTASTKLDTSGITWDSISISGTQTLILLSDLNISNLTVGPVGTVSFTTNGNILSVINNLVLSQGIINIPNNLQIVNFYSQSSSKSVNGSFNVFVSGDLNIAGTTTGTASFVLNGSGTWSGTSVLYNNITIIND